MEDADIVSGDFRRESHKEQGLACRTPTAMDLRASRIIRDTEERLHGLHADAYRSNALLAELEALLASSQAASRGAPPGTPCTLMDTSGADTVHDPRPGPDEAGPEPNGSMDHPTAWQPLETVTETADENDAHAKLAAVGGEGGVQENTDHALKPASSAPLPCGRRPPRRRSSIIIDGSLFGALPPAGISQALLGTIGGNPASAPEAFRLRSARRPRGISMQGAAAAEGRPDMAMGAMRRRTVEDAAVSPMLLSSAPGGFAECSMPVAAARLHRRSSTTELQELMGRFPSSVRLERGSRPQQHGFPAPASAWPARPPSSMGSAPQVGSRSDGGGERASPSLAPVVAWRDAAPVVGSRVTMASKEPPASASTRTRSGPFMKMLKGLFTSADRDAPSAEGAGVTQDGFTCIASPVSRPQQQTSAQAAHAGFAAVPGPDAADSDRSHREGEHGQPCEPQEAWDGSALSPRASSLHAGSGRPLVPHPLGNGVGPNTCQGPAVPICGNGSIAFAGKVPGHSSAGFWAIEGSGISAARPASGSRRAAQQVPAESRVRTGSRVQVRGVGAQACGLPLIGSLPPALHT